MMSGFFPHTTERSIEHNNAFHRQLGHNEAYLYVEELERTTTKNDIFIAFSGNKSLDSIH